MGRRRKPTVKPVLSAFVAGILIGIGVDPGQMIFETAVEQFGPYLQFASLIILAVVLYFTYGWVLDALKRSKIAYRRAGLIGVAAIICALLSGIFVFSGERAIIVLVAAMAMWLYATWR